MSHIFDGLQRLEGDRPDFDASSQPGVTELLRLAERRAASKWESTVLAEQPIAAKRPDDGLTLDLQRILPVETVSGNATAVAEPASADEHKDLFDHFQSLQVSLSPQSRLPCLTDSGSPAAEAFRLLGVRLRHLRRDRTLKKVLITSTIPQEGKSTVAANLACTLALETHQKTLLLEGDLRRPSLSEIFGLRGHLGLGEWLEEKCSLTKCIYHLEGQNVWVLPAGSARRNALELLQLRRLPDLLDELAVLFDWMVIDSPPVLPLADTSVWMRLADGILLATRLGVTEKKHLKRGLEAVENKKLIGALVNSSTNATADDYYYYGTTSASRSNDVAAAR